MGSTHGSCAVVSSVSHCVKCTNAEPFANVSESIEATLEVVLSVTHGLSKFACTEDSCKSATAQHKTAAAHRLTLFPAMCRAGSRAVVGYAEGRGDARKRATRLPPASLLLLRLGVDSPRFPFSLKCLESSREKGADREVVWQHGLKHSGESKDYAHTLPEGDQASPVCRSASAIPLRVREHFTITTRVALPMYMS